MLDLIDTPGHVDFTYEVSRALNACEGAILVVDAAQGIEAQTISNLYMAIGQDLEIIPVLNKVDLPSAQPDLVAQSITDLIGGDPDDVLHVSAKTGLGIDAVLERIVERVPAPAGDPEAPLQALIFDSTFDTYRGSIVYVRVKEGTLRKGDAIQFMATGAKYFAEEIGHLKMGMEPVEELGPGEVGYIIGSVKDVADTRVGDTVTHQRGGATEQLPGYRDVKPMVFSGIYPTDSNDFEDLRAALEKLQLNDAALTYEPETSAALGFGFRVGFLGMLHMEVVQERLDREFGLDIVTTMPNVRYTVELTDGSEIEVENPSDMPDPGRIHEIREPYVKAEIITPVEYVGTLMGLCQDRRGTYVTQEYLTTDRVNLKYELPLAEIVFDFYDKLKSVSRGYASFDYDFIDERDLEAGQARRDAQRRHRRRAVARSSTATRPTTWAGGCRRSLRELIPRQMFDVAIQAGIGNKIIARETVKALRKDVTAKCYGGDISPQAQAAGEAEGGQEADEAGRRRRGPPGGLPGRPVDGVRAIRCQGKNQGMERPPRARGWCFSPSPLSCFLVPVSSSAQDVVELLQRQRTQARMAEVLAERGPRMDAPAARRGGRGRPLDADVLRGPGRRAGRARQPGPRRGRQGRQPDPPGPARLAAVGQGGAGRAGQLPGALRETYWQARCRAAGCSSTPPSTAVLRGRFRPSFGRPTRNGDAQRRYGYGGSEYIQFEYWFVVNDSIPVLALDIDGPFGTRPADRQRRAVRRVPGDPQGGPLRPPRRARGPVPWLDYYHSYERGAWFRTGYNGVGAVHRLRPPAAVERAGAVRPLDHPPVSVPTHPRAAPLP